MLCAATCGTCWGALTLTYINHGVSATNASSYNFGNFSAPTDGLMIAVASGRSAGSTTFSSVSIGGSSGTIVESQTGGEQGICIATRAVSSGNNNVTVTFGQSQVRASVGVWLLTGYASATPYDTDKGSASLTTSATRTLDYPAAGGVGVYGVFLQSNAAENITWANATERYDVNATGEASSKMSGADRTASGTAVSESISWPTNYNSISIGACWEESSGGGGSVPVIFRNWLNHSSLKPKPERVVRAAYIQPFAAQLLSGSLSLSP